MPVVKAIIFDLDDTLLDDKRSIQEAMRATCEQAAKKYDIDPEALEEKVRDIARERYMAYETYAFAKKIGINPFEGLWGTFDDPGEGFRALRNIAPEYQLRVWKEALEGLGIKDADLAQELAKAFPEHRKNVPYVYADTYTVLDELKDHYALYMLTNGAPSLQRTKLALSPRLEKYFTRVFISGDFGIGKPDPSIFKYVLDSIGITSDDAIMVGDNLNTDILGANRVGMRNVWINRNGLEEADVLPTYEIKNLTELIPLMNSISKGQACADV
ncbi:HAD family hydrolase [Ornithinibacillus hominis]|uniref:HAD family hydrolase n=1 Tax=Ornithinibacillus hominis TaxID=2763055 RepID=UPI00344D7338